MKIVISTTVSMPIYEQIINQIRDAVVSGELKAGDGGCRQSEMLAKELAVSVITTKRAYEGAGKGRCNRVGAGAWILRVRAEK